LPVLHDFITRSCTCAPSFTLFSLFFSFVFCPRQN